MTWIKQSEELIMESTMKKYAERIERNEIDPHIRYDGKRSGLILDPHREEAPLELLGFGIYQLSSTPITRETGRQEIVLVPQEWEFEAEVNGKKFSGRRDGGPFSPGPGKSNASALYIPCNAKLQIRGKGEMAFFEAPALREKPPFYLPSQEVKVVTRGKYTWRRDVVSLISPKDASTNLVVGETWSPPGLWSGTPLHQHDKDDRVSGESDHEEIYYHRFNWKKKAGDEFGPYGIQLLMDGKRLTKSYVIGEKSIFAIPGGCHPVVASPVSELLYLWGLAGSGGELMMRDIPEFAHLKSFEAIFAKLEAEGTGKIVSGPQFERICASYSFAEEQKRLLKVMLVEMGYRIE
jgi:5-deoxy-D-glucuronate isomerase